MWDVLGDSLELFGCVLSWVAIGVVLLGEGIIGALDLLLTGHSLQAQDGCVGTGILCALNALTVVKKNLETSFMGDDRLDLLIIVSL
jgi:hypothetical protein